MRFQVTAERSAVYEVEDASNREEAIDKMMAGDAKEVDGTTHSIVAVPLCPTPACDHNAMVERPGDGTYAWECAECGYIYGEMVGDHI